MCRAVLVEEVMIKLNINMKKIICIIVLFTGLFATGQVKKWTLEECITYALENNLTIEQLKLQLESIKLGEKDALGAFLPSVNANASGSWSNGRGVDPTTNTIISGTFFSMSGGLSAGVNLFDGLNNVYRMHRAKLNTLSSQYQVEGIKEDMMLNVANAYLQVLASKESLKAVELQAKITEQDYLKTKELVEAGVVPKGDLLELEATMANFEQQKVSGMNAVLLNRLFLAQLLQITDYENFDISDDTYEVPPSDIFKYSAKEIFAKAMTFRNDMKVSELNVKMAEKDVQIAKGARYPRLGASFNYNTRYSGFVKRLAGTPFTTQLSDNDGIGYGLSLNVPIFNGFSVKNNISRSKINLRRSELQFEQDKLGLEANVNQAYLDVRSFAKTYEASQKTLAARQTAYQYAKDRFEVGYMNSFDFSQSQSRMDSAEIDVITAKYNYIFRIKILELYFGLPITLD